MTNQQSVLAISGCGPASLSALVQLYAQKVRDVDHVLIFSRARYENVDMFPDKQRLRLIRLNRIGIDTKHLSGAGVWHPADPAKNFTINGSHGIGSIKGIAFPSYVCWLRDPFVRLMIRWIYPEWLQQYPAFWRSPDATSPRGLIGIWLHCQFIWVCMLLRLRGIKVDVIKTANGVTNIAPDCGDGSYLVTAQQTYPADKVMLAFGNRLRDSQPGVPCYPAEKWIANVMHQKPHIVIYGGGPSAIECAFYALDYGATHVTLLTRTGYARLARDEVEYTPRYFTEKELCSSSSVDAPTAHKALLLLQHEWQHFCDIAGVQAALEDFLHLEDFVSFMQEVEASAACDDYRPELRFFPAISMSFTRLLCGQKERIFPESEWDNVTVIFNKYRYLFETISAPASQRLIKEVKENRKMTLSRTQFFVAKPDMVYINATGLSNTLPPCIAPLIASGHIDAFPAAFSGMKVNSSDVAYIGGIAIGVTNHVAKNAVARMFL